MVITSLTLKGERWGKLNNPNPTTSSPIIKEPFKEFSTLWIDIKIIIFKIKSAKNPKTTASAIMEPKTAPKHLER